VRASHRDDDELLRIARADPGAFALFYDRYEEAVAGYLSRRVWDPELVADLTAEVFACDVDGSRRGRGSDSESGTR
jgi:hypothetical protein